ncbi:MAG: choice-of-anchor tandem repeat GloVer-containing protein, partial [Bacteroidota bacterium]
MKKIIIFALCLGFLTTAFSQGEYWGVSLQGGDFGAGSIYKLDEDGQNPTTVHQFEIDFAGDQPNRMKLAELNGVLYGTTFRGGKEQDGVLFSYEMANGTYSVLHNFDGDNTGNSPNGSVAIANSKVYGSTWYNGPNGASGTLFAYDIALDSFYLVELFDGVLTNGGATTMITGSDGNIYGTMQDYGSFGDGLLFKVDPTTDVFSILYELDDDGLGEGIQPENELLEVEPGLFYGTTEFGGDHNDGVLYSYDLNTNTYTKLFDFNQDTDGRGPVGNLAYNGSDKLFGVTDDGGNAGFNFGVLFSFDLTTNVFDTLYNFYSTSGYNPDGGVFYAGNDLIYGTLDGGGEVHDNGTLFEYNTATQTFTKKVDFDNSGVGSTPSGNLIEASNGKLYGGLSSGGVSGDGAVYEYTLGDTSVSSVIRFGEALAGAEPETAPLLASDGLLYGVVPRGGSGNDGLLYQLDPSTGTYINLVDFDSTTLGSRPNSQLVEYGGLLYGTLNEDGVNSGGSLFSYDPN